MLRVAGDVIVLTTCLWPDEVRTPDFVFLSQEQPEPRQQEQAMAEQLVEMLSKDDFKPEKYTDAYREALQELIDAKLEGREPTVPQPRVSAEAAELTEVLKASIEDARSGRNASKAAEEESASGTSAAKSGRTGNRKGSKASKKD